jgi:hypothetical protein
MQTLPLTLPFAPLIPAITPITSEPSQPLVPINEGLFNYCIEFF